MTTRRMLVTLLVFAMPAALTAVAGERGHLDAATQGALKVKIEYKGAGKVDKEHRIWVWLFDTPTIDGSSVPIAANSLDENGGAVTFDSLPETVYAAVAFDDKGGYDGTTGPPPSGTPVQVYGDAGTAKAIKTGTEVSIQITFDDSVRMP